MLLPDWENEYMKLNNIDRVEMIMVDWIVGIIYHMSVSLKNVCLKNIRTYKNSLSAVFCYILEFKNIAIEIRNFYLRNFFSDYEPIS